MNLKRASSFTLVSGMMPWRPALIDSRSMPVEANGMITELALRKATAFGCVCAVCGWRSVSRRRVVLDMCICGSTCETVNAVVSEVTNSRVLNRYRDCVDV